VTSSRSEELGSYAAPAGTTGNPYARPIARVGPPPAPDLEAPPAIWFVRYAPPAPTGPAGPGWHFEFAGLAGFVPGLDDGRCPVCERRGAGFVRPFCGPCAEVLFGRRIGHLLIALDDRVGADDRQLVAERGRDHVPVRVRSDVRVRDSLLDEAVLDRAKNVVADLDGVLDDELAQLRHQTFSSCSCPVVRSRQRKRP
jgi:hypothetical protein